MQLHLQTHDLNQYSRFYRANLINSISGYKPAMLIGTKSAAGHPNLAIFSSIVHLGADPALLGFIQRPVGQSGDTYRNIIETGTYTFNHVPKSFIQQAHYTSARFPAEVSEFEACHFTEAYLDGFYAPYVAESPIQIGLEFVEALHIRHNDTRLIIGQIKSIYLPETALAEDGHINLHEVEAVSIAGLMSYHQVSPLAKFPYAKVAELPAF